MSQEKKQPESATTNPYAAYGYSPQGYYQYGGFVDPNQYRYSYPYQQAPGGFQAPQMPTQGGVASQVPGMLPLEESYIENILRLNKGKLVTVYMTFENNEQKVFKGVIEAAGRDHIILSDPQTGVRYLLLMVYLDYVVFPEEVEYEYPFASGVPGMATYPPR